MDFEAGWVGTDRKVRGIDLYLNQSNWFDFDYSNTNTLTPWSMGRSEEWEVDKLPSHIFDSR